MRFFLLTVLFWCPLLSMGQQGDVEKQQIMWLAYHQKAYLSKQWSVHTELDGRWFTGSWRQQQWLLPRLHVHYQPKQALDLGVGASYFMQALPQNEEPVALLRPEFRPHQEVTLRQPAGAFKLEHRYRLEERFQRNVTGNHLSDAWDFSWRFRYRLQFVYAFATESRLQPSLKFFDEIMLNAGKGVQHNLFDQNRIGASLSLKASRHIAAEFGYMYWFQQRPVGNKFYSRDMLRFSLLHNIFLYTRS